MLDKRVTTRTDSDNGAPRRLGATVVGKQRLPEPPTRGGAPQWRNRDGAGVRTVTLSLGTANVQEQELGDAIRR